MRLTNYLVAALLTSASMVQAAEPMKTPLLLELFTSEGCSSCPPADLLFSELLQAQPFDGIELIGLAQHVDYWNRLGWKDRFSSPVYSQRQRNYSQQLANDNGVYTPQIVVHGKLGAVGSRAEKVFDAIDAMRTELQRSTPLSLPLVLNKSGSEVLATIETGLLPKAGITLTVALVQSDLSTDVKAGENHGRKLKHDAVARVFHQFKLSGQASLQDTLTLPSDSGPMRVVVVAQNTRTGRVLAVAQQPVG